VRALSKTETIMPACAVLAALCFLLTFLVCARQALPPSRATTPTHQRTFSLTDASQRSSPPLVNTSDECRSAIIIADLSLSGRWDCRRRAK